jgi:hypothetical protein
MPVTWKAPANILDQLNEIQLKHHSPRLDAAKFVVALSETKPFIQNRFNWGAVKRFSEFQKIWLSEEYDFCIVLCSDVWHSILNPEQKEALLDLHLSRCSPEYVPETVVEGKKKKVVKDEWGRVKYTNEIKYDENGNPKWVVHPLDLEVFTDNVLRYGLWCSELCDLGTVIAKVTLPTPDG